MSNTTSKPTIYTDYQKISIKDIVFLLVSVSEKTAQQYYKDIKKEYEIPIVLFTHFKQYFKITEIMPKTN
jgi:hypothetical protein